jgi:hypothetical protein
VLNIINKSEVKKSGLIKYFAKLNNIKDTFYKQFSKFLLPGSTKLSVVFGPVLLNTDLNVSRSNKERVLTWASVALL